jgi:hypothetical protein
VAVTAKISALEALVNPAKQMDKTRLNVAIIPNLAPGEVTTHRIVVEAMGNIDATMLVIKFVIRNSVLSL